MSPEARTRILSQLGAQPSEISELLRYTENAFTIPSPLPPLPLASEPHLKIWQHWAAQSQAAGAFPVLQQGLLQLQFPVQTGISRIPAYQAATRKGIPPSDPVGLTLDHPERIRLEIYPTLAGEIPMVICPDRADFVRLVQALLHQNEPQLIPESIGAFMLAGYNNWARIRQLQTQWQANHPGSDWGAYFQAEIMPQKSLYQDSFILLSDSAYSGVPASALGLSSTTWQHYSLLIRRDHECTHYCTRRLFGSMRNNLLDELLADYWGIKAAVGQFRGDWFLHFMGLERFPDYRWGGRLEHYRADLSDGAFRILQALVVAAAHNLEQWDQTLPSWDRQTQIQTLIQLGSVTLEALGSRSIGDWNGIDLG